MKLLNRYQNGNVIITLFDNGTKIQEWNDNQHPDPEYPVSMDVKITNSCDAKCNWCHEMSIPTGKHGDLHRLIDLLKDLPKGTELAIGGGNVLEHPYLLWFLTELKLLGLIANITINYKHLEPYIDTINYLLNKELIYGLGLSILDDFEYPIISKINKLDNVAYHVIAGINQISVINKIASSPVKKVLILGYKTFGRGTNVDPTTLINLDEWKREIQKYIKKIHLSFDNLAIKQLNIKNYLSESEWNKFYMGDDGVFTMYIDAVKEEFALSSTSKNRYKIGNTINNLFNIIKNERQGLHRSI